MEKISLNKENGDYILILFLISINAFGLLMLYSTSYYNGIMEYGSDKYFLIRQFIFVIIGFISFYVVSIVKIEFIRKFSFVFYGISILLMLLVLTPLGVEINGARRWVKVPITGTMQPSEIGKISIILLIPHLIKRHIKKINDIKVFLYIAFYGAVISLIMFLLNDHLSSAIITMGIVLTLLFVVNKRTKIFIIILTSFVTFLYMLLNILGTYLEKINSFRAMRILVWLYPEKHTSDGGYQVLQGLYAIGSGGLFGKGLGNSIQKLGIIPEVQNDMILTIICEELGVVGLGIVILLYIGLLYRIVRIGVMENNLYNKLICIGVFLHLSLQIILNISVVLNVIPTTGITLPFISYGGTSVIFLLSEIGLVYGISRNKSKT